MGAMRYLLATAATLVTGLVGGILGWWAGLAMDRFRWLGLGPEEFWRTDPENVWVWGFIIGSVIGIAVALAVSAWWLSRTARTRRKVQDNKRQGV
jgi:MFS family permease